MLKSYWRDREEIEKKEKKDLDSKFTQLNIKTVIYYYHYDFGVCDAAFDILDWIRLQWTTFIGLDGVSLLLFMPVIRN